MVGGVESVVVGGGWDLPGKELASVSMFMPYEDKWVKMSDMMAPRVDFTLHVNN
jgi:proline racemase